MKWKDISSFSKSDKSKTPKTFELQVSGLKIAVHRHIHYSPDVWLLSCEPWFKCHVIGNGTAETACKDATQAVFEQANALVNALRQVGAD
jgi:hypothetical protein